MHERCERHPKRQTIKKGNEALSETASVHLSMDYGVSVLGGPLWVMQVSWAASKFKATSYCSVHPIILSASLRLFQYHQNLSTSGCKVLSKTSTGRCEIPLDPKPSLCADDGLLEKLSVEVEHPSTGQSFSAITYLGEPVRASCDGRNSGNFVYCWTLRDGFEVTFMSKNESWKYRKFNDSYPANGPWNKSLNFIFATKYEIPTSWKFSHWPGKNWCSCWCQTTCCVWRHCKE